MTAELDEAVTVGGLPDEPGKTMHVRANAGAEYVSGARLEWYANMPRALPWAYDSIQTDFGSDIWEQMMLDAQVRATVNVLKASVLEDGITLTSPIEDKDDDGYEQAAQLVADAERMFDEMNSPLDAVLWDMGDAVALGNRVAELVFDLDTTPSGKQQYTLQNMAVKPRESVAFVVDAYLNVLGILGRIPGQPFGVQQGMLLADIEHTPNLLPRSKFAVLTFRPRDGDPRGTSVLRPCFSVWQAKTQLQREWLKYLAQFATPSLVGFTAEGSQPYPLPDATGVPMVDAHGNVVLRYPEQDMVSALQDFANGTVTAFAYGAKVQPIEMTGDGAAFLNAFQFLDMQITKAVLHQTLATEEGQHQSRAASSTHKDILDTVVHQAKRPIERMLSRDVLRTWMRLNGNEKLLPLMPKITLGTAETEDKASLWMALSRLYASGAVHPSQFAELDRMVGLPERTPPDATGIPVKETVAVKEDGGIVQPPTGDNPDAAPDDETAPVTQETQG
jgi:hypothetical protein